MWEPNAEQRERMARILTVMRPFLEDAATRLHNCYLGRFHYYSLPMLETDSVQAMLKEVSPALKRLLEKMFPSTELLAGMADIVNFPREIQVMLIKENTPPGLLKRLFSHEGTPNESSSKLLEEQVHIALLYADWWLTEYPPTDYAVGLFLQQLAHILEHPLIPSKDEYYYNIYRVITYYLDKIAKQLPHPQAYRQIERIFLEGMKISSFTESDGEIVARNIEAFEGNLPKISQNIAVWLFQHGALSYPLFRQGALREPQLLAYWPYDTNKQRAWCNSLLGDQVLDEQIVSYTLRLHRECAEDFRPEYARALAHCCNYRGVFFLLMACKHIERLKVKKLSPQGHESVEAALGRMAHLAGFLPGDDLEAAVATLRGYQRQTLELVLPVAGVGSDLVLRALDAEHWRPLLQYVFHLGGYSPEKNSYDYDLKNSSDPTDGVLDIPLLREAVRQAGEQEAFALLKRLQQSGLGLPNTLLLVQAALGLGREDILKRLPKRQQMAVKAYGLLPLENEAELLERYLFFQRFAKESKQFGPERQANERAASTVGLANLAQIAGYADTVRLEWAMESRLSAQALRPGAEVPVGEYTLWLELADGDASICCRRSERALKSVPAEVKKSAEYMTLTETLAQLRDQGRRFRAALEEMMIGEQTISRDELDDLTRLPMARPLLPGLIFQLDGGEFGFFAPDDGTFSGLDARPLPAPAELRVAHVLHLFHAGQLAAWQREVLRRRLRQPFKQAFRELYLLTPAEADTHLFSNRFCGHTLNPRVTVRLFQARGWRTGDGEFSSPCKAFPRLGLQVEFAFPDAGHFLTETEVITSDTIAFLPYPHQHVFNEPDARLPLADIPPVLFSEVMRDADLVVSVAQQGEGTASHEMTQRRGELVQALLTELGLSGVRVEGHFAYVHGARANYRVHLGSAAIHFDPGSYLCIVPAGQVKRPDRLFLPFADAEDPKFCEVISKIFLLRNDAHFTDETILAQIRQQRKGLSTP